MKPENVLVTNDNILKLCDFSGFRMDTEAYKSLMASVVVGKLVKILNFTINYCN